MPPSNPPPALPEVYDEAGDSPRWVPALGAGLFIMFVAVFATRVLTQPHTPPTAAPDAQPTEQPADEPAKT
jgi:hypothetical protein